MTQTNPHLPLNSPRVGLGGRLGLALILCIGCQGPSAAEHSGPDSRTYEPIDLETFMATDADRHQVVVESREEVTTVDRVSCVEFEGAGLHLLQPLRDIERHGGDADGEMAAGLHFFPTKNRYPSRASDRPQWASSWRDWPVSIEPLIGTSIFSVSLWDGGGYQSYRLEMTFPESARGPLTELLGTTSASLLFQDWCDITVAPGETVTDLQAVLVGDGTYYYPFSVRDMVLEGRFPVTLTVADGLSREEAFRLLKGMKR
ncbi:MAG: hypothetical protein ACI9F9_001158 [Candidatus Paceibacteria bacterium]|jgi:hypothetical protein